MSRAFKYLVLATVVLVSGMGWQSGWASTVPFSDDFDTGYSDGSLLSSGGKGWESTANGSVVAVVSNNYGLGSTKGAIVPAAVTVSNLYTSVEGTNVWTDFWVKPQRFQAIGAANPTLDGDAMAFFYVNSNGYIVVAQVAGSSTNWITLTNSVSGTPVTPCSTTDFVRISVNQNYISTNWAIFQDGLLLREGLASVRSFAPGTDYYKKFEIANGGTATNSYTGSGAAVMDNVVVSTNNLSTLTMDANANGMFDAWEIFYFGSTSSTNTQTADLDGDTLDNAAESANNFNPWVANNVSGVDIWYALPYTETFETLNRATVNYQHGWKSVGTGMDVQGNVVFAGTNALVVGQGEVMMTNVASAANYTNVWTDLVIKPGQMFWDSVTNSVRADTTVAFYVNTNGYIVALNGSNWEQLDQFLGGATTNGQVDLKTNDWVRLVLHSDYVSDTWSLYVVTNAVSATNDLARMVGDNLAFAHAANNYNGIRFTNFNGAAEGKGYIDNVYITTARPDIVDTDGDLIPDNFETAWGMDPESPAVDTGGAPTPDVQEYVWGTTSIVHITRGELVTAAGNDVQLFVNSVGSNRTYTIYGSTLPTGTLSYVGAFNTGPAGANNSYTDNGIVGSQSKFFYTVSSTMSGMTVTDTVEFAWYKQDRTANSTWYPCSTPVDYPAGSNNLNSTLGTQLATGLGSGDELYVLTGGTWVGYTWNGTQWLNIIGGAPANKTITAGTGMFIQRKSAARSRTNTVLLGNKRTNANYTATVSANWNMLGWAHHLSQTEGANAGAANAGWNFLKSGAVGSTSTNADQIWIYSTSSGWKGFRLLNGVGANNGRWYRFSPSPTFEATVTMDDGNGFFYLHRGSGFTWTNQTPQ